MYLCLQFTLYLSFKSHKVALYIHIYTVSCVDTSVCYMFEAVPESL